MCGIAGALGPDREQVRQSLLSMNRAMSHRGPDAEGIELFPFGSGWLGLAHRRLSILDLSPLGHQPMMHAGTSNAIVFNGEIYNYPVLRKELEDQGEQFRSGSDTEALLAGVARQGANFIPRLEGMYAFAQWRPKEQELILARDPLGIKPLFMAQGGGYFLFASEVRAILASGLVAKTISPAGVATLLAYGSCSQPLTLWESVRMMPPGCWQIVVPKGEGYQVREQKVWWSIPKPGPAPAEPVAETAKLLEDAVKDHLMADVPVGVFLSAGLDSAAIAGMAAKHTQSLRCFTVGFSDQPDFDEMDIARDTANFLGLPHTPIIIPAQDAEAAAVEWLEKADLPSMDGLNTFVISKAVRANDVKVALCGLGADELFGGYETFREVPKLLKLRGLLGWLPSGLRSKVGAGLMLRRPQVVREKLADALGGENATLSMLAQRRRAMSNSRLKQFGYQANKLELDPQFLTAEAKREFQNLPEDVGWIISALETRLYQTNVLLRDSDANGMAHSIEIRVPFLDQRLQNRLHTYPGSVRFPANKPPKWLLREAAKPVLHPQLFQRKKTGFGLPIKRWMLGPLKPVCEAALKTLEDTNILQAEAVRATWQAFLAEPESPMWSRAFTLVTLGDYLRRHGR